MSPPSNFSVACLAGTKAAGGDAQALLDFKRAAEAELLRRYSGELRRSPETLHRDRKVEMFKTIWSFLRERSSWHCYHDALRAASAFFCAFDAPERLFMQVCVASARAGARDVTCELLRSRNAVRWGVERVLQRLSGEAEKVRDPAAFQAYVNACQREVRGDGASVSGDTQVSDSRRKRSHGGLHGGLHGVSHGVSHGGPHGGPHGVSHGSAKPRSAKKSRRF